MQADKRPMEKNPRMLALLTMAEKNSTLSFAELSKELEITDTDKLEEFLIKAIQRGSIKGKIDEQRKEFKVTSLEYIHFGRPQWELLRDRLNSLLENVSEFQKSIQSATCEN